MWQEWWDARSHPSGNVQEGTLLPVLLRLTLLYASLPFSLFQHCLSHHRFPFPASSSASLPELLWHFTALPVITNAMEKCFGGTWPGHAGVERGKGWEFYIPVQPGTGVTCLQVLSRAREVPVAEEMLAMPLLGCWQSWHHDQGWLCPVGNAEHEQGPKQEAPTVRPRHELGVALQPHHIPSPPVIWGMRGWLWDMGGHKPSARHVGRLSSGESAPAARTVQCHFKAGSGSEAGDCLVGLNHIGTILERVWLFDSFVYKSDIKAKSWCLSDMSFIPRKR